MKKLIAAIGLVAALALTGCFPTGPRASVEAPSSDAQAEEPTTEAPAEEPGTRANPAPIGSTIEDGDWAVTVNSVNLNANDLIAAENQFNDAADEGYVYILVNITATYNGTNPDGELPWINVEYVTADGNTINGLEKLVVEPEAFDMASTLYQGASVTGNKAFHVPTATAGEGTLAVRAGLGGTKVFVAVQ
ncbi:MAG: hypothetical protein D3X82_13880 [Candidatus Leucobacter sulfamidivorax]|nr:hypothetical protein [Candidatus Leucobacter sulfamidivorax]